MTGCSRCRSGGWTSWSAGCCRTEPGRRAAAGTCRRSAGWASCPATSARPPRGCFPAVRSRRKLPLFGERLLSQFAGQSSPVFQTGDGDEYRWCETRIEVGSARKVWPLLIRPCLEPPSPPIRNADGYYAYLKSLPGRFWTRNTPDEIEYAGEIQPGRLTNLGTIRRGVKGFTVNANSVRRAADLEAVVLAAASAAGCPADVTRRSALTAEELASTPPEAGDGPDSREATCRRLGIEGVSLPEQRRLILEGYFLPVEHGLDEVAREINRELGYLSVLESRDKAGMTPAEAVAAGAPRWNGCLR